MLHLSADSHAVFPAPAQGYQRQKNQIEVLLIEDDEADAFFIKRTLLTNPRVGNVVRAVDGIDALDLIYTGLAPDLAIVDLLMPRMDGFVLVDEFAIRRVEFPMVVLTTCAAPSDVARRRLWAVAEVLTKQAGISEMRNLLDRAIHSYVH